MTNDTKRKNRIYNCDGFSGKPDQFRLLYKSDFQTQALHFIFYHLIIIFIIILYDFKEFKLLYKSDFFGIALLILLTLRKLKPMWQIKHLNVLKSMIKIKINIKKNQGNSKKNIRLKWTAVCLTLDYLTGKVNENVFFY